MPTAKPVPLPVGQVEPDLEAAHSPKRIATGQFAVVYEPDTIWPKIIEKIASGRSLADALRQPGMPSYACVITPNCGSFTSRPSLTAQTQWSMN